MFPVNFDDAAVRARRGVCVEHNISVVHVDEAGLRIAVTSVVAYRSIPVLAPDVVEGNIKICLHDLNVSGRVVGEHVVLRLAAGKKPQPA